MALVRYLESQLSDFSTIVNKHILTLRHEAYVNPIDFVLKNDHVTFMGMSETHAWFR